MEGSRAACARDCNFRDRAVVSRSRVPCVRDTSVSNHRGHKGTQKFFFNRYQIDPETSAFPYVPGVAVVKNWRGQPRAAAPT